MRIECRAFVLERQEERGKRRNINNFEPQKEPVSPTTPNTSDKPRLTASAHETLHAHTLLRILLERWIRGNLDNRGKEEGTEMVDGGWMSTAVRVASKHLATLCRQRLKE